MIILFHSGEGRIQRRFFDQVFPFRDFFDLLGNSVAVGRLLHQNAKDHGIIVAADHIAADLNHIVPPHPMSVVLRLPYYDCRTMSGVVNIQREISLVNSFF